MFVDRPKHCPVCLEQKFSTVVDCGVDLDPKMIKEIWVSSPHEFYFPFFKCINCKTYYTQRYVDDLEIPKLYSLLKDNLFGVDEDTYFQIQDSYAAMIKKYFCNEQTQTKIDYFELGPDHGVLRKIIGDKVAEVRTSILVEPNKTCWPALKQFKPDSLVKDFGSLQVPDKSIDLAVAVHVLDHMLFPNEFLGSLAEKMRKGACIFIVVHNGQSFLRRLMGRSWPPFCIHHPQIFNGLSLSRLLEANGFDNVLVKRTVNKFPLGFLISNVFNLLGLKCSWSWGPKISLPLGNIAVLGKKI
ncbi:MAG: hypothetical protein CMM83_05560 [Rhodospirillales bacterium]|nr:hypothetical protein [Rhodospirillales bacterium]|tara:strand:- start:768 stop:1664 length:897 start_codon:yes stop_codon:yes gene_type:complete